MTTGIVVDEVNEVLRVPREKITATPPTVADLGRRYLSGIVKLDDRLLILLRIAMILGDEDECLAEDA